MFQEKTDKTLNYQTLVWLEHKIIQRKGDKEKHRKKLFTMLEELPDVR